MLHLFKSYGCLYIEKVSPTTDYNVTDFVINPKEVTRTNCRRLYSLFPSAYDRFYSDSEMSNMSMIDWDAGVTELSESLFLTHISSYFNGSLYYNIPSAWVNYLTQSLGIS